MPKCEYHDNCRRDGGESTEERLCILHSQNPQKDVALFNSALAEHRESGRNDFSHFVFPAFAEFLLAEFAKGANFKGAMFREPAQFHIAKFEELADFTGAEFAKGANFILAEFTEGANFRAAKFTEFADFSLAKFVKEADFYSAEFAKADFSQATFATAGSFNDTKFFGRTIFTAKNDEQGHTIPIFKDAEVDFRRAYIEPLDSLIFRGADLSRCRFLDTDLRGAEFTNVTWPIISNEKWIGKRVGVCDETSPPEEGGRPYAQIERLYRELKQNHEDRRDYERAGDFHYGEKEMRRKNPETPAGLKFFLTLYWAVSGYGERYLRPLIWAGALLFGCAFLYLGLGLVEPAGHGHRLCLNKLEDWLQALHYSFRVMTLLKAEEVAKPDGYAKMVSTVQSLLGPLFLGLFGLALRQRLKR